MRYLLLVALAAITAAQTANAAFISTSFSAGSAATSTKTIEFTMNLEGATLGFFDNVWDYDNPGNVTSTTLTSCWGAGDGVPGGSCFFEGGFDWSLLGDSLNGALGDIRLGAANPFQDADPTPDVTLYARIDFVTSGPVTAILNTDISSFKAPDFSTLLPNNTPLSFVVTPEPGALVLLGLGLVALSVARKRSV